MTKRKYIVAVLHSANLSGFPGGMFGSSPVKYVTYEIDGYLTSADYDKIVTEQLKNNKCVLSITDVTGEPEKEENEVVYDSEDTWFHPFNDG